MHGVEVADISVCVESVESDEDSDGMSSPNSVLRFVGKRDSHVATDNMRRERDTAGKENSNVFDGEGESSVHELCSERMRSPDSMDTESRSCVDDMDTTGYMSPDSVETEREMVVGEVDTEGERSPDSVETEREMVVGEVDTEGERSPDSIEMEFDFAAQRMDTVGQTHAVAKQVYNVGDRDTAGITMADLQGAAGSGVSNPADARGPDRRMDAVDTQEQDEQVRRASNVLSGVGVPKVCGLVSVVHDSGTSSLLPNIPADTNHDLKETDFHSTLNIKHNSNAGSGACSGDAVLGSRASELHNLESKADLASGATNAYASAGKVHAMCDLRVLSSAVTEKVTHEAGREASLGESDTTHREDPVDNRTGLVEGGTDRANASATDTHALNRAGKQTVNSAGVGAENDALSMGSIASGKEDTSPCALGACATVRSVAVNPTSADPQAKLKASISWILTKAYGSSIPSELKDPFYENAKGQPQVKPQLVNLMTSSEVYCQACSNMFTDTASQWQGHWSIIQVLSRKGIYVAEAGDTTVTETVLMHTAPFKVAAHLSLIDALMKAYASEIASVERIVQAVRRYSSFNASSELPGGVEEALMFWVNKTCAALVNRGDLEIIQGESNQKVRIVSKSTPPRDSKTIPKMENLMSDLGDGCSVGATIAFYQPESLPVADVCLKDCVGIADSLYNLRLIRTFCERHLVLKCFHFTYEDLLYGRENLHENVLVFMAELFYLLEACVQADSGKEGAGEGAVQASGRRIQSPGIPQVSSATKRSFQKTPDDSRHPTEKITATPSSLPSRQQPLLQRRTTPSRRSQSLSLPQERETVRRSVIAWQDDQDIRERGSNGSTLLENVSVSWDADDTDFDPVSSADLADFEFTGHNQSRNSNLDDPNHPEFLDMTSVTPGHTSARLGGRHSVSGASTDRQEPLMPAKLRPAKEKVNNHSKAEERGDRTPKKKMFSPTKPTKGKLSPPGGSVQGRVSPSGGSGVGGGGEETASQRSSGSSMDETIVTPLASVDFATPRSGDTITSSSDTTAPATQQQVQQQQPQRPGSHPAYDAFMIAPDSSTEIPLTTPRRTASRVAGQGEPPATSYTLESQVCDSQTARDLGLPVIGQSTSDFVGEGAVRQVGASREGSIGSSRSSGDFSDHESHKIHQDHKARESLKHSPRRVGEMPKYPSHAPPPALSHPLADMGGVPKPGQLITDHLPDSGDMHKKPGTTSFAQIRRMKGIGNVDNSGVVYMQQEQRDQGGHAGSGGSSLKAAFQQKADSAKRATFARLPNETTWQQSAQRNAAQGAVPSGGAGAGASASNGEHSSPPTTELSQLRLKLEEKRREIERKKHQQEVHTAKMRQRLGKAAFMRVINKQDVPAGSAGVFCAQPGLTGLRGGRDLTDSAPLVNPPSCLTQALLQERLGQVGLDEASRPATLTTHSPISSNSTSASESPSTAAGGRSFSREGIQQTIDGVRRRWFHGSDPEGDVIRSKELEDENGVPVSELSSDMMQSCPPSMAAAAFGYSPQPSSCLGQEARASPVPVVEPERVLTERVLTERVLTRDSPPMHPQVREVSQSPRRTPERGISSGGGEQEYDQSLDNLNRSLTELQGEIKRLTLQQQEQFRTTHSPQGVPAEPGFPQHPPHQPSPPHLQPPHQQPPHHQPPSPQHQQKPAQPQQPLQPPSSRTAHGGRIAAQHPPLSNHTSHLSSPSLVPSTMDPPSPPSSIASHPHPAFAPEEEEAEAVSQEDDSSSGNGFFISMGEDTPRRPKPKPKLGKGRDGSVSRKDSSDVSDMGGAEFQRVPPLHGGGSDSSGGGALAVGGEAESSHSGSHTSLQGGSDDGSSGFTYMVGAGQEASVTDSDLEMQKKKERIIQAQIRRKEEQERKKMEKEMETQRRMQKKMLKEEEQEKKKAEEKSRREAIFQKYLQKKQDQDEEKPSAVAVTRRERSNSSQPRPKSMFVKARGGDSGEVTPRGLSAHSSQEDLSSNTSPSGSNVSCNQLTQNGSQGASTYRRPPSPRGRPPSPGPKLFVKPNSKSNRHIIINALSYCCLAGIVNTDVKNKVLEEIARSATKHFLILFRDHGCQYRGLYNFDPESEEAYKITGIGPRNISSEMVEKFYKYNSGGKSFNEVTSTKHLSVSIDAVVLMNVYWKAKVKPASGR
ncbi:calmodulin-regulated spectrin-associated protein 1-like isoform X2 [Littorina saxatilis]|uniref:calmodulin-regulated spectrin-associated protein 1-like isoform X2 n=1 Tax=Littorina saxatilis TaxID=31220 RepID=UPI0038B41F33